MHYFFIDNQTKKIKNIGTSFINPKLLAEFGQKSVDEVLTKIESELKMTLVELSHQLPQSDGIEFMFVLPSRADAMLAQTTGVPPVGRWLPKVVEIISDHVDGDFRYIDVYFDDNSDSFGVTVAKVNEKTGFVDWCCPEYKNHPQVFEHIANL